MAKEMKEKAASKGQSKFMQWYESYSGKKIVGCVYSLGASIVIVGALFKIMHFPGAGPMLIAGMSVEALLCGVISKGRSKAPMVKAIHKEELGLASSSSQREGIKGAA